MRKIFFCLVLTTALIFSNICTVSFAKVINLEVLDVGQGDSILIKSDRKNILVDTGDFTERDKFFAALRRHHVTHIHALILTHPHADHIGNAGALLDNLLFTVDRVFDNGLHSSSRLYAHYVASCTKQHISREVICAGDVIDLGGGAELQILYPARFALFSGVNNSSIVLKIVNGNASALLTGDIESDAEESLLKNILRADVLKVAHHGSKTSTAAAFLDAVKPSVAVISCGINNKFGHPHQVVIDRLQERGIDVYDTRGGDISVELGENEVRVKRKI